MGEKRNLGELLIQSMEDAIAYERGELPGVRTETVHRIGSQAYVDEPPVYSADRIAAIRKRLALSQRLFAGSLHVSLPTVRAWEQGTRKPEGAALRLLEIAETHPELLAEKVHVSGLDR